MSNTENPVFDFNKNYSSDLMNATGQPGQEYPCAEKMEKQFHITSRKYCQGVPGRL
jgi:hypothetical protein